MDYLTRDKAMTQMQLELLSEERTRLRGERDAADRVAAALRGQFNDIQDSMAKSRQDLQCRIDNLSAEAQVKTGMLGQAQGEAAAAKASHAAVQHRMTALEQVGLGWFRV